MVRNIDEVMDSMEKMSGPLDREKEKPLFEKLNESCLKLIDDRKDMEYIVMSYNEVLKDPYSEIHKLNDFLGDMVDAQSAVSAVDPSLHRNVR